MRFKPEQFTGNPDEQARKARLARLIYALHDGGSSWADSEYYAWLAVRHDIEVSQT